MRCVVTGATGYVAGFVVAELEETYDLTLFARRRFETRHRLVTGDLTSEADCLRAIEGADVIIHLGAKPEPSSETFTTNAISTYRILDAARVHGIPRVVMASSNCVYGHCYRISSEPFLPDHLPINEGHPVRPEDSYSLSKVVSEELLSSFQRAYGIEVAALRLAWVWGEKERNWWLDAGRSQADSFAEGLWGYVDARDAARAFRLAVEIDHLPEPSSYNVNAGDTMVEESSASVAMRLLPHLDSLAAGLVGRQSFFSIDRARDVLGWEPKHSWIDEEGVR